MNKKVLLFSGAAVLVLALGLAIGYGIKPSAPAANMTVKSIPEGELNPEVWGKYYPDQYASYLKNKEMTQGNSKYGGSAKFDRLERDPMLKTLFSGYGFGQDYTKDRGHIYAIQDVLDTKRKKPSASCWTCKGPEVPGLINQMGDAYYTASFDSLKDKMHYSVSCADCHDPKTMDLKITRPAFIEGLKAMGKDPNQLTRQEMRSAVCGQCHVTYYFAPKTNKVIFPWANGMNVDQISKYENDQKFSDWTMPDTKTPMAKVRHPEYEMFSSSVHAANGVSCADCHMPYVKEGQSKISSHHWESPLNTISQSCQSCHKQSEDYLKKQVIDVQDKTNQTQMAAEKSIVAAIDAIKKATNDPKADQKLLEEARQLHRDANFRWDFVASENSTGFHNPTEALRVLGEAIDLGHQAEMKATQAMSPKQ